MQKSLSLSLVIFLLIASVARAAQPVDPDLIPEARKVLDYLESEYGKKVISGMASYGGWTPVFEISGQVPAIYANDAMGWNKPNWGESYRKVLQESINSTREWWHVKGGIPAMQWHWGKPGRPDGSAWVEEGKGTGPADVGRMVTPGTEEYKAAMEDMQRTADYLEQLAKDRVPVIWRPLHEIDGGWFWWTDKEKPENTAELYRMMFNYFVKERKLHNLIWVFNPGVHPGGLKKAVQNGDPKKKVTLEDEIAFRKRYYPGAQYVDIAGIDIYPDRTYNDPTTDTYHMAYEIMKQVAPGKMLALCEAQAIPNPGTMQKEGPQWLYALPWFAADSRNSAQWIRTTYTHPNVVTLESLPQLVPHNIAPNARLLAPADGGRLDGTTVEVKGHVIDRDGNLKSVAVYDLAGPWKNWFMRDDKNKAKELAAAVCLGEARPGPEGEYTFTWRNPSAGLHNLYLVARDAEGVTALSNFARVSVGLKNLAAGCAVQASSDEKNAARAVDGDLFSAWAGPKPGVAPAGPGGKKKAVSGQKNSAKKKQSTPVKMVAQENQNREQWLAVDLGAEKEIGAAAVTWWKAYAKEYRIEVSSDGTAWKTVYRQDAKKEFNGDTDVIRFAPVKARHARLVCVRPGTNWGGYNVYDFEVFAALP